MCGFGWWFWERYFFIMLMFWTEWFLEFSTKIPTSCSNLNHCDRSLVFLHAHCAVHKVRYKKVLLYFVFTSPTFCLQFKEFSYLSLFQDYLHHNILCDAKWQLEKARAINVWSFRFGRIWSWKMSWWTAVSHWVGSPKHCNELRTWWKSGHERGNNPIPIIISPENEHVTRQTALWKELSKQAFILVFDWFFQVGCKKLSGWESIIHELFLNDMRYECSNP